MCIGEKQGGVGENPLVLSCLRDGAVDHRQGRGREVTAGGGLVVAWSSLRHPIGPCWRLRPWLLLLLLLLLQPVSVGWMAVLNKVWSLGRHRVRTQLCVCIPESFSFSFKSPSYRNSVRLRRRRNETLSLRTSSTAPTKQPQLQRLTQPHAAGKQGPIVSLSSVPPGPKFLSLACPYGISLAFFSPSTQTPRPRTQKSTHTSAARTSFFFFFFPPPCHGPCGVRRSDAQGLGSGGRTVKRSSGFSSSLLALFSLWDQDRSLFFFPSLPAIPPQKSRSSQPMRAWRAKNGEGILGDRQSFAGLKRRHHSEKRHLFFRFFHRGVAFCLSFFFLYPPLVVLFFSFGPQVHPCLSCRPPFGCRRASSKEF
ncbi:hypothetical protein J3F83DRAFT_349815 [Trichoderma novae-zelandiae]